MNKIEEMIKKLCPNGVEYKALWEITYWDKKFKGIEREKQTKVLKFKHILAAQLKALEDKNGDVKLLATGYYDGFTTSEKASEFINEGEVITIPSGGYANIKYYSGKFVDSGNILASSIDCKKYNLKYIYHILLKKNEYIQSLYRGGSVQHPDMIKLLDMKIPVPPIAVQQEIVKVLDTFSELTAELTAELAARKKQYAYYKHKLLSFENLIDLSPNGVEYKELSELCEIRRGKRLTKSELIENGKYAVYHGSISPLGQYDKANQEKDTIIIINTGSIGEIGYSEKAYWCSDACFSIQSCTIDILNNKFLYYYLIQFKNYFISRIRKGGVPTIDKDCIAKIKIPVPPLEVQEYIVNILDKFDSLVNDIMVGLPAEIAARQKQYAYYRDKLLTFASLK